MKSSIVLILLSSQVWCLIAYPNLLGKKGYVVVVVVVVVARCGA